MQRHNQCCAICMPRYLYPPILSSAAKNGGQVERLLPTPESDRQWPSCPRKSKQRQPPRLKRLETRGLMANSLHSKLFPVFTCDEAVPRIQNNERKRRTIEIWFAHKEIVKLRGRWQWRRYRLCFLLSNLVAQNIDIHFKTQRAYVEVCRQAALRRCPHMRTWV